MGIYYSLISVFSSPTSINNRNVHSINTRSKSLKNRRRRYKRHHLLNRFFLGSNHFCVRTQPHTCLFHEYYTLNSSRETLLPIYLQLSLPEYNSSTIIRPIECTIAIRRDSFKLIHCYEDWYSIDFIFDADRPVEIYSMSFCFKKLVFPIKFFIFLVYFMAHEVNKNNNETLSYVCCTKINPLDTFKQYHAFTRPAGHGQIFSSIQHDIRFQLSALNEEHYGCSMTNRLYPVVVVCRAINTELTR
jgi:hypothetical protein